MTDAQTDPDRDATVAPARIAPEPDSLFSPRALLVATIFGLVALAIVLAGLTIPIGGTGIVTDPREIFTTVGAGLTGPVGGLIIGVLAGIKEPQGIAAASVLAHVAGGLWMGWSYKKLVYERLTMPGLLAGWAVLILIYYFVVVVPGFVIGVRIFNASDFEAIYEGSTGLWSAYTALARGVVPEALLTTGFTTLILLALPRKYRRPLW